jgi:trehalose 6-phosphate synthase/phosphatase
MVSGIRSLSATHEQVWVGWTGDILAAKDGRSIPTDSLTELDRKACNDALARSKSSEGEQDDDSKPTTLKTVWLSDKVAHKHYEGYSKHSASFPFSF